MFPLLSQLHPKFCMPRPISCFSSSDQTTRRNCTFPIWRKQLNVYSIKAKLRIKANLTCAFKKGLMSMFLQKESQKGDAMLYKWMIRTILNIHLKLTLIALYTLGQNCTLGRGGKQCTMSGGEIFLQNVPFKNKSPLSSILFF